MATSSPNVQAKQWGSFLIAIFEELVHNYVGWDFIQLFDSALGSWLGRGASLEWPHKRNNLL